jgi:hypothetical protein
VLPLSVKVAARVAWLKAAPRFSAHVSKLLVSDLICTGTAAIIERTAGFLLC